MFPIDYVYCTDTCTWTLEGVTESKLSSPIHATRGGTRVALLQWYISEIPDSTDWESTLHLPQMIPEPSRTNVPRMFSELSLNDLAAGDRLLLQLSEASSVIDHPC